MTTPQGSSPAPSPSGGPTLSTREATSRSCVELGVIFGQASGGRDPVLTALTNLQAVGQEHGCDAIVAVRLMSHSAGGGLTVVAYGTGVRFISAQSPPTAGAPPPPVTETIPKSEAQQAAAGDSPSPPSHTRS